MASKDGDSRHGEAASVRLPRELIQKLRIIAQHRNTSAMDYLDSLIRSTVEREYRKAIRDLHSELGGEG